MFGDGLWRRRKFTRDGVVRIQNCMDLLSEANIQPSIEHSTEQNWEGKGLWLGWNKLIHKQFDT